MNVNLRSARKCCKYDSGAEYGKGHRRHNLSRVKLARTIKRRERQTFRRELARGEWL